MYTREGGRDGVIGEQRNDHRSFFFLWTDKTQQRHHRRLKRHGNGKCDEVGEHHVAQEQQQLEHIKFGLIFQISLKILENNFL